MLYAFCSYYEFCLLNKGYFNLFNWLVVTNNSENLENTLPFQNISECKVKKRKERCDVGIWGQTV